MPKTLKAEPVDPSRARERSGTAYHRDERRHAAALKAHGKKPNTGDPETKAASAWKWVAGLAVLALGGIGVYAYREFSPIAERNAYVEKFSALDGIVGGTPQQPILAYLGPKGELEFAQLAGYDSATIDGERRIFYTGEKPMTVADGLAQFRMTRVQLETEFMDRPLRRPTTEEVKRQRVYQLLRDMMLQAENQPATPPAEKPKPLGLLWDSPQSTVAMATIASRRARLNAI